MLSVSIFSITVISQGFELSEPTKSLRRVQQFQLFAFPYIALEFNIMLIEVQSKGFNYGFVEYDDPGAAERAMQTLNGRRVHQAVSVIL